MNYSDVFKAETFELFKLLQQNGNLEKFFFVCLFDVLRHFQQLFSYISTIFKVSGLTRSGIALANLQHPRRTLFHYTTEAAP